MNEEERVQRKLAAILSADVAGYSRLMRDDEVSTVNTISTYRELMSALILQHQGRVIDTAGDALLAEFASVVDAVQSAVAIQKELKARNAKLTEARKMEFRIGINIGDVIQEGDRIYGDGVNIAARLEGLAEPGGICISRTAYDQIESKLPFGYEYLGEQTVKNINKPVYAYRVVLEPESRSHQEKQETKTGPKAGGRHSEQRAGDQEQGDPFRQVRDTVQEFAREIAEDEKIGETFKEIKDKVRGFADDMAGDPERRQRAIHKLIHSSHVRFFLGFGAFLFVLNVITSFGTWWFQYPLISIGLVLYVNWLRISFFSSEEVNKMRQKFLEAELAKISKLGQDMKQGRERTERRVKARVHFYMHLYLYLGVNVFLLLLNLITSPFHWWFQFPLIGWGILLFLHWMGINTLLPKE
jgi:class 3 adenylate cyclase